MYHENHLFGAVTGYFGEHFQTSNVIVAIVFTGVDSNPNYVTLFKTSMVRILTLPSWSVIIFLQSTCQTRAE